MTAFGESACQRSHQNCTQSLRPEDAAAGGGED